MPGQQLVQFSGRVIIDPAEHVGEPGLRINAVQLGGLDQREHRGGTFPTEVHPVSTGHGR